LLIYVEEQCTSGPCCDTSTKKYKPSGSQPTGYNDYYDCSGTNSPTGTSYVRFNDYYCNGQGTDYYLQTSNVDTCGTCKYCESGQSTCKYYSSSTSCGTCKLCNGQGSCSQTPSDDDACGTIDCSSWYIQTGTESAQNTEYCYNKKGITTNRCESFGDCKDANTADCNPQENDALQYSCGLCKYITQSSCTATTLGTCSNYAAGTSCGTNKECDANGNCETPQCDGTDTSCGVYPNCANCNANDGCDGNYYKDYYCINNQNGCGYTPDYCGDDCSCSCGGYNAPETPANGNCNDGKDNDCDGLTDSNDPDCCQDECVIGQKRCNGDYKQTCDNYDDDNCLEWGGDIYCNYGCSNGECIQFQDITIINGKVYVNGKEFLVKGIDYAPWLLGTGPDPNLHNPFPNEYDDVTNKVTNGGTVYVTDYNGDGKIQMWEVIQYDMDIIKGVGANTIRTYASGEWHDKNLNGIIDITPTPETDEIVEGDLPNWMLDRIVDFCEENDMTVIIGYWVQEEDFKLGLECNWDDLAVAKDTLKRVVERYSSSPAVLAWGIGNEVNGFWNHEWFTWGVNINDYLNSLYSYVRSIDNDNKPIMYARYIGENTDFNNLDADIIAPNAYIFSAQELIDLGEFNIPPPQGKAYLVGEFGHIIEHAEDHWNLAKQYAGGCFLEYNDVWWKGEGQNLLGVVEEYRAKKPERYNVLYQLYVGGIPVEFTINLLTGWNLISFPINLTNKLVKDVFRNINFESIFSYGSWLYYFNESEHNFNIINESKGYWVNSLGDQILTIEGTEFESPEIPLKEGWNLVGYPYLEEKDVSDLFENKGIYSYNGDWSSYIPNRTFNSLTTMKPGSGYLVNVK